MQVVKRSGALEDVQFDKVLFRVRAVAKDLAVDSAVIAQKVVSGLYDKITSSEIDTLLAETAAMLTTEHPDYSRLASRIAVSNLHKNTKNFYQSMKDLSKAGVIGNDFIKILKHHGKDIEKHIKYERDFDFTYFGFKTLERSYLLKANSKIVERPQHLWMRVALALGGDSIEDVLELYDLISTGKYTHATPTLFNAGTIRPQLASCYLLAIRSDDSLEGIYSSLWETAQISKYAGGIGIHVHNIRARGSRIAGTNGHSEGLVPMLRLWNETARYVNQGGKRKGSVAVYLETWHADIEDFIKLKYNTGEDKIRCRDLFLALWVSDLFMERVKNDGVWSLMCPHECPGLNKVYGKEFEELYCKYEAESRYKKQVLARDLFSQIVQAQIETGVPYMLNKDSINKKSNQKNIGIIESSNLCTEIVEVSNDDETAVCTLASQCLPKHVVNGTFDFEGLKKVVKTTVKFLNRVIDKNFYPNKKTSNSNNKHRPIGIGVQGLADVFFMLDMPFESPEARKLNRDIFEALYFAALEASCEIAEKDGAYSTFKGSPASEGILQFDMWDVEPSAEYDWAGLKEKIKKHGLRNSLLVAPMPTASTAQIFDNIEAFEAQTSNIYKRETLSGEYIVVNKHLVKKLMELGLWNSSMRDKIISGGGSVQVIPEIPIEVREIYKTVWEISQKTVIDMAADRGAFIDQSQSMNLFLANPTVAQVASMHAYSHSKGLKTMMYYLRSKPSMQAQKVTTKQIEMTPVEEVACSLDNPEDCVACSA